MNYREGGEREEEEVGKEERKTQVSWVQVSHVTMGANSCSGFQRDRRPTSGPLFHRGLAVLTPSHETCFRSYPHLEYLWNPLHAESDGGDHGDVLFPRLLLVHTTSTLTVLVSLMSIRSR